MNVEFFVISQLNGVSDGLLLFMLSSGLTRLAPADHDLLWQRLATR